MGRPRAEEARVYWKVSIPETLAVELEMWLQNPTTKKPEYGLRSKLLEILLREALERLEKGSLKVDNL